MLSSLRLVPSQALRCTSTLHHSVRQVRALSSVQGKTTGFIGLGNMGFSMARNLLSAGHSVVVLDMDTAVMGEMGKLGAVQADSVKGLAAQCDVVVTMLPASKHVQSVLLGEEGVMQHARKGALLIDCSTISPMVSRELHVEAGKRGLRMIDAPVSGGVTGAAAGTLTFMVGGDAAVIKEAEVVLNSMGKNVVRCGDAGAGGVAKLCNNLSLAIQMIATSEAMNMGIQLGLDPKTLAGILNTSTGRCWSSEAYNPVPGVVQGVPSGNSYKGGFGVALMSKDLGLAMDLAEEAQLQSPLGIHAAAVYRDMTADANYSSKDFSIIYEKLSQHNK
ncbi:hypothetical protein B484DRAFT_454817 [Ochromonadaceae sp. CCMP2298]|nr:hypothetical protein B484DRAFT_454817 [Ochromonadaceae sp. CCMP2298]|eukprot:CAMPEP_0173196674 /NCGR_PEP_ID=MMETSP1141-20130122/15747_1 /TAXON_ID=483371 /ORGANISM="non described non described, Strain CCMP2298" /LENGTH=331 /DNA_ID=CAMNT_0014121351 /DNA_START=73 /DNA_END=1068 /DNA_ORIENTATION=+